MQEIGTTTTPEKATRQSARAERDMQSGLRTLCASGLAFVDCKASWRSGRILEIHENAAAEPWSFRCWMPTHTDTHAQQWVSEKLCWRRKKKIYRSNLSPKYEATSLNSAKWCLFETNKSRVHDRTYSRRQRGAAWSGMPLSTPEKNAELLGCSFFNKAH